MRIDVDRTLKILLIIICTAVVGYFGWQIVQRVLYPLTLFLMAATVAFILSPLVERLHSEGFPKPLAILIVYLGMLGAVSLLGFWLINPLIDQIQNLKSVINDLPHQANDLQKRLNSLNTFLVSHHGPSVDQLKADAINYAQNLANSILPNIGSNTLNLLFTSFNYVVNTVLTLVIAYYLLMDGQRLKKGLYQLIPTPHRDTVLFVEATINEVLGGYLRGQLLMALTIGTMAGVGTFVLGISFPAVVGVLAGILEMIPMLGPWLASMPALVIALFSPHPWPLTLWVALYFLLIQQLESNVIGPRITGHAVGLHPLGAMMALLVGIELDGILGALFAVPVAGILWVLATALYYRFNDMPRPEPQREVTNTSLIGSLGGRLIARSASAEGAEARARMPALRLRRPQPESASSKRLATVTRARDALRDKMAQADAPRGHAAHRSPPEPEERHPSEPVAAGRPSGLDVDEVPASAR